VELFTFPERLAMPARALQREDMAPQYPFSETYSHTLREVFDFFSFAGVTSSSRTVAWLQILKPRMALIGAQRLASPGGLTTRMGQRVGVTLMNFGVEPIECIFGQYIPEPQAAVDCSVESEAEAFLKSFNWATPPVAIVIKACEGVTVWDARQLLGFSTRSAAHDVPMMMAKSPSEGMVVRSARF
jgi:hypothetical protein